MRRMSLKEQQKVLDALVHNEWWADFQAFDSICYGGDVRKDADQREYCRAVIKAFPKDILKDYDADQRKVEANKLRAKADKIEQGKEMELD